MTQITERQSISAEEVDGELLGRMFDTNSKELPKTTKNYQSGRHEAKAKRSEK